MSKENHFRVRPIFLLPFLLMALFVGYQYRRRLYESLRSQFVLPVLTALPYPAPAVPETLPLVGEGRWQTVDPAALREVLLAGRFPQLESMLEEALRESESNPRHERWVLDAYSAFYTADPRTGNRLAQWRMQKPNSYMASLASAYHFMFRSVYFAGTDDVPRVRRNAAASERTRAGDELRVAQRQLGREIVPFLQLRLFSASSAHDEAAVLLLVREAEQRCPTCYEFRRELAERLWSRWAHNQNELASFLRTAEAHVAENPLLAELRGLPAHIRCLEAKISENYAGAVIACGESLALAETPEVLVLRAEVRLGMDQIDLAREDLLRAIALDPIHRDARRRLVRVLLARRRMEEARTHLQRVIALNPVQEATESLAFQYALYLLGDWYMHTVYGREAQARAALQEALQYPFVREEYDELVANRTRGGEEVQALESAVRRQPDNLDAIFALDMWFIRQGQPEVPVALWSEFLLRHPNHPRALRERAGALHHLGNDHDAILDWLPACAGGDAEACSLLQRFGR